MNLINLFERGGLKALGLVLLLFAAPVNAFNSGSTGVDGAFAPVSDTTIVLPPDGILNYTTLNIPVGVTVRIASNIANTPGFILIQGDAVIDGTLDISGVDGGAVSSNPAGGFAGGLPQQSAGGNGQGPGGGIGGPFPNDPGNGGSYGSTGNQGVSNPSAVASIYGSTSLQPLLGGSGGGASGTTSTLTGNRGGGGGGALLIAASGILTLTGTISASGGDGASSVSGSTTNFGGGGGSGGGVRLIASTLTGNGTIDINGGAGGIRLNSVGGNGGSGGIGRARLEADIFSFSGTVTPNVVATSAPQAVFAANLPTIRISTIGGSTVPTNPIGENDVILPSSIINPVTVEFAATDVPLGSTVELTVAPIIGASSTVVSAGLSGTVANSTDSVQVTLPQGASVLLASVSFAVTAQLEPFYAPFTDGEMVARVELRSTIGGGPSSMRLTTVNGRIIDVPTVIANL